MTNPCMNNEWSRLPGRCLDFRGVSDLASQRISFAKRTVSDWVGINGVALQKSGWKMKDKGQQMEGASWCLEGIAGISVDRSVIDQLGQLLFTIRIFHGVGEMTGLQVRNSFLCIGYIVRPWANNLSFLGFFLSLLTKSGWQCLT